MKANPKKPKATKKKDKVCKLICPRCKEYFADLKFNYDTVINPEDIVVVKGDKKSFQQGEELKCTLCGHTLMSWDIYLAIAEAQDNAQKA
jgi:hypothetical protein